MKNYIVFTLVFAFSFLSFSQEELDGDCGTDINSGNISRLQEFNDLWLNRKQKTVAKANVCSTRFIPVQLHIIRQNNGTGGISAVDLNHAFDLLNDYYISANVHFYQCSAINYIDNSTYFDYNKTQVNALYNASKVDNVLNIYIANSVSNASGGDICGHAYFPGSLDFVMQSKSCVKNGSTLAHEVGHYLGLYHTHETQFGSESVNGSDCATEGDLICDTPADPKLSKSTNVNKAGCIYYGTDTDEDGSSYVPSVTNIMSYSAKECRHHFTEEQKNKILWVVDNQRTYLNCTSPPTINASFYLDEEASCAPNKLFTFYNASDGDITTYAWDFGDGIGTSNLESPTYSYTENGIFNVKLVVGDGTNTDSITHKVVAGAVTVPYINGFENGNSSLNQFVVKKSMKNELKVASAAAKDGNFGLLFDGTDKYSSTPTFQTPNPAQSFQELWNPHYKATAKICVDASFTSDLKLEFDKRQLRTGNHKYTNFRITINGVTEGNIYQVNNANSDDPNFTHITVDLSAYDGQVITIGFEGNHRYDRNRNSTNGGTATFLDNIKITGTISALPIELLNFTATPNRAHVNLAWVTSSETNNDFFTVEKSEDGFIWEELTKVGANGNSTTIKTYKTTDEAPFANTTYYRLKQTDFNGNTSYSEIRMVNFNTENYAKVYPNPTKKHLTIETNKEELQSLRITDMLGKEVTNTVTVQQINEQKAILDLTALQSGIYYIQTKLTTNKIHKL